MRKVFFPKAKVALGLLIGCICIQITSVGLQLAIKAPSLPNSAPIALATISLNGQTVVNEIAKQRRFQQNNDNIDKKEPRITLNEIYHDTRFLADHFIVYLNQRCFRDAEFYFLVRGLNQLATNEERGFDPNDDPYSFLFYFSFAIPFF